MLTLAARRGPCCRTQTGEYAFLWRGLYIQRWSLFATAINASHVSGLSRTVTTDSRPNKAALPTESHRRASLGSSRQSTGKPPKPKTEAWYNNYLSMPLRYASKPYSRYNFIKPVAAESEVRSALRDDPLELFNSKPLELADLHQAGKCLDLYIARHDLKPGQTLAQTREHFVRDKPGTRALAWSCSLSDAERHALWGDVSFTLAVTYCMVAEDAITPLWDWLKLDMSIGPKDPFGGGVLRWIQHVLHTMVEAQVFWSEDKDHWADAIKSFLESQRMRFVAVIKVEAESVAEHG